MTLAVVHFSGEKNAGTPFFPKAVQEIAVTGLGWDFPRYAQRIKDRILQEQFPAGVDGAAFVVADALWQLEFIPRTITNTLIAQNGAQLHAQVIERLQRVLDLRDNPLLRDQLRAALAAGNPISEPVARLGEFQVSVSTPIWSTPAWAPETLRAFRSVMTDGRNMPEDEHVRTLMQNISLGGVGPGSSEASLLLVQTGLVAEALEILFMLLGNRDRAAVSDGEAFWRDLAGKVTALKATMETAGVWRERCEHAARVYEAARGSLGRPGTISSIYGGGGVRPAGSRWNT